MEAPVAEANVADKMVRTIKHDDEQHYNKERFRKGPQTWHQDHSLLQRESIGIPHNKKLPKSHRLFYLLFFLQVQHLKQKEKALSMS